MGRSWPVWVGVGGGLLTGALVGLIVGRDTEHHKLNPQLTELTRLEARYHTVTQQLAQTKADLATAKKTDAADSATIAQLTQQVDTLSTTKTQLESQISTLQAELAKAEKPYYTLTAVVSSMPWNQAPGPDNTYAYGNQWLLVTTRKNGRPLGQQTVYWNAVYPQDTAWLYPDTYGELQTQSNGMAHRAFHDAGGTVTVHWTDPAGVVHTQSVGLGKGVYIP